jgi:hypothetical protein
VQQGPPRTGEGRPSSGTPAWIAQLRHLGDELTAYADDRRPVASVARMHAAGMRRLTELIEGLGATWVGPDRQAVFFALRSVAIEAERAMRLRNQLDRFPEWTWRPILRARVDKITGCLNEVCRLSGQGAASAA